MTQDEIVEMARKAGIRDCTCSGEFGCLKAFAKLVAAKAIAKLESQEPVAWIDFQKEAQQIVESKVLWKKFIDGTPLANDIACWMADFALQHTHPPQHTWQGLTDEEAQWLYDNCRTPSTLIDMVEAKLKEKNSA